MSAESGITPQENSRVPSFVAAVERKIAGIEIPEEVVPIIAGLGRSLSLTQSLSNSRNTLARMRTLGFVSILTILEQNTLIETAMSFSIFGGDSGQQKNRKGKDDYQQVRNDKLIPYLAIVKSPVRGHKITDEAEVIIAELGYQLHLLNETFQPVAADKTEPLPFYDAAEDEFLLFDAADNDRSLSSEYADKLARDRASGFLFVLNVLEQREIVKLATKSG